MARFTANIVVFWLLAQMRALAQESDTLLQLPAVEINATSLRNEVPGSFSESWTAEVLAKQNGGSVADFLQKQTSIYVKSYGGGSLATTSVRGASAGQTAVLWNGFQVQSPMLGQLDWSLLPIHFADEVSFQHGGNTAAWGSGAVGGAVLIQNKPDFDAKEHISISAGAGSFGALNGYAAAKFSSQQLASSTRLFYQKAENDFTYYPPSGQPSKRQTNAAQRQLGLMQEAYWRPSGQHQLGCQVWLQRAYREIPPTTTQNRSEANQKDDAARLAFNWSFLQGRNALRAKSALFREAIHYSDPQTNTDAPSHFWTGITEAEWQHFLHSKITFQIAGNQTFTKAFVKNYPSPAERWQSAVFTSMRYQGVIVNAQLDSRLELVDGSLLPVTPSLGLQISAAKWLAFGAKIGRNYRLPTLNDLYWAPGGNPDLLAESGWSEEANARLKFENKQLSIGFTVSIFNRNIKNWILWHPTEGQPYWSASNLAQVWSRGVEQRLHLAWTLGVLKLKMDAGYDFIRSTNCRAIAVPRIGAGQQLIYVPENQGFVKSEITLAYFSIGYRHQFTGAVLTDLGSLPGFQIGTWNLEVERPMFGHATRFFLQIDNAWNVSYRVIERRPMPGKSFQAGCSMSFVKN